MTDLELSICHSCKIEHYENCPECFGFGIYGNSGAPVSAGAAHDAFDLCLGDRNNLPRLVFDKPILTCPYCGSDIFGVPENKK